MNEFTELRKVLEREVRALREVHRVVSQEEPDAPSTERPDAQQRNSELETLRLLVLRQDDEIRILQKQADDMRQSLMRMGGTGAFADATPDSDLGKAPGSIRARSGGPSGHLVGSDLTTGVATSMTSFSLGSDLLNYGPRSDAQFPGAKEQRSRVPVPAAKEAASWKENLDGILSMLDAMEREVQN